MKLLPRLKSVRKGSGRSTEQPAVVHECLPAVRAL